MIKSWYSVFILIFFLICISVLIQNSNKYSAKDFYGVWNSEYKNYKIKLELKDNKNCSLSIFSLLSNKIQKINGSCNLDLTKKPNTFKMTNIIELNSPLYSIVFLENNSTLHMSEFSSRWRIRPIEFENNKKIVFKKKF